jgi:hypothetical protein
LITDNSSDSEDLQDNTPNGAYTIYIPIFLDDTHQSQRLLSDLNADLLQKNLLAPDLLVREIEDCFPTKYQISSTFKGDNVRDLQPFKVKVTVARKKDL